MPVTDTLTTTSRQQDLGGEGPVNQGNMTQCSESRPEAMLPTPLLTPKKITKIATWNIRTVFEAGKAAQVAKEMESYNVLLLGPSEARWNQSEQLHSSAGRRAVHGLSRPSLPPRRKTLVLSSHSAMHLQMMLRMKRRKNSMTRSTMCVYVRGSGGLYRM